MNINDVRDQLAAAATEFGFHAYSEVPPAPEFPAVIIGNPIEIRYHRSLKGRVELDFDVLLIVTRVDDIDAQRKLSDALSVPGPLTDLERWRPDLPTTSAYTEATVAAADNFDTFAIGETRLLAAHLDLTVKT